MALNVTGLMPSAQSSQNMALINTSDESDDDNPKISARQRQLQRIKILSQTQSVMQKSKANTAYRCCNEPHIDKNSYHPQINKLARADVRRRLQETEDLIKKSIQPKEGLVSRIEAFGSSRDGLSQLSSKFLMPTPRSKELGENSVQNNFNLLQVGEPFEH